MDEPLICIEIIIVNNFIIDKTKEVWNLELRD